MIQSTSKGCANVHAAACVVCAGSVLLWTSTELSSTLVLLIVFNLHILAVLFHTVRCMYIVQVIVRSWGAMVYGICIFEGVYVISRAKPEELHPRMYICHTPWHLMI